MNQGVYFGVNQQNGSYSTVFGFQVDVDRHLAVGSQVTRFSAGVEETKAVFQCRDVDYKKRLDYLRQKAIESGLTEGCLAEMLEAVDAIEQAKVRMAQIIEKELTGNPDL